LRAASRASLKTALGASLVSPAGPPAGPPSCRRHQGPHLLHVGAKLVPAAALASAREAGAWRLRGAASRDVVVLPKACTLGPNLPLPQSAPPPHTPVAGPPAPRSPPAGPSRCGPPSRAAGRSQTRQSGRRLGGGGVGGKGALWPAPEGARSPGCNLARGSEPRSPCQGSHSRAARVSSTSADQMAPIASDTLQWRGRGGVRSVGRQPRRETCCVDKMAGSTLPPVHTALQPMISPNPFPPPHLGEGSYCWRYSRGSSAAMRPSPSSDGSPAPPAPLLALPPARGPPGRGWRL
jgi:hypothetical protein